MSALPAAATFHTPRDVDGWVRYFRQCEIPVLASTAASIAIGLGWVGGIVMPQIVHRIGVGGTALLLVGGVAYTAGVVN